MKVHILFEWDSDRLMQKINSFIVSHKVLSIQYQMSCTNHQPYHSAMITYMDDEETD